jgi:asparagine synthase (glutamine-hydrolysing)
VIGILSKRGPVDEALARRALAAVPYPTPAVTIRRVGDALLGIATRTDFVDECISREGETIAAMTGRIDNAAEIRAELTRGAGRGAKSETGNGERRDEGLNDADLVVAAFAAWGWEAVRRFRGAFSILVTDGTRFWAVRDHVGFRGLFYRDDPAAFIAAGEARQVIVAAQLREEPDLTVVELLYYGGMPSHTPSALKGADRLAQGAIARVRLGAPLEKERWWTPWTLFETARPTVAQASEQFLALLKQSCERSLTGRDVVFLSGGLDSPAIAAYAAPAHRERTGRAIGALSAIFPDLPDVDETGLIEIVAKRFGMKLDTFRPTAKALDDAIEWSRKLGTAVPTLSIPEVSEAYTRAKALGYDNVLTGEFAEITYGKYPHALSHLLLTGRWGTLLKYIGEQHRRGASRSELALDALSALVPGRVANWWMRTTGRGGQPALVPSWIQSTMLGTHMPRRDLLPPARQRYKVLQLWGFEGSTVTMEADATTAAIAGVTIRRPFADVDLWEFFLSLPPEVKFPWLQWKALARHALRGVIPDEILDVKKKTYFDPHVMQQVDYPLLERLFRAPKHRINGIDYGELARRIAARDLAFADWLSARDLARVHAFLEAF